MDRHKSLCWSIQHDCDTNATPRWQNFFDLFSCQIIWGICPDSCWVWGKSFFEWKNIIKYPTKYYISNLKWLHTRTGIQYVKYRVIIPQGNSFAQSMGRIRTIVLNEKYKTSQQHKWYDFRIIDTPERLCDPRGLKFSFYKY